MDHAVVLFIFALASIHFAGILLLIINSLCLVYKRNGRKRWCKIKSDLACNVLFLYHVILLTLEMILALVCQIYQDLSEFCQSHNLVDLFLILAGTNYLFLLLYLAPRRVSVGAFETDGHTSSLNTSKSFAFVNFLVFWSMLGLLASCSRIDCRFMSGFETLANGYGLIPLLLSYIAMLCEAYLTSTVEARYKNFESADIISKDKAIAIIQQRFKEQPRIEGLVVCSHEVCAQCGKYFTVQIFSFEQITITFLAISDLYFMNTCILCVLQVIVRTPAGKSNHITSVILKVGSQKVPQQFL